MLTAEQCAANGLTRHAIARLLAQEYWQRVLPGVYSLSSGEPSWLARCWIGILLGGDHACLGGLAAAHLHGLVADPPKVLTVLIPQDRSLRC